MKNDNDLISQQKPLNIKLLVFSAMLIIALFFGGLAAWSMFFPLESAALAQGSIKVDSNRKTIQHLEGGIIADIFVREGDEVQPNDKLIKLDDTQAKIKRDLYQGQANHFITMLARLKAEQVGRDNVHYPKNLLLQKDNDHLLMLIEGQQETFLARKRTHEDNISILNQKIKQFNEQIKSYQSQVLSAEKQLALINEEIEAVAFLEEKKLIERPRLLALQRRAASLTGDKDEKIALISQTKQQILETKIEINALINERQKQATEEMRIAQAELSAIQEKLKSAQDVLDRTVIYAPQGGRVVGLKIHTLGGVIAPREELLDIVPNKDELIVEAKVSPLDIDVVRQGLLAKVQLSAFSSRSTPMLSGTVSHVSADVFQDKDGKTSYYIAKVNIPPKELDKLEGLALYPGMPTQVIIVTEKKTLLEYLFSPIQNSYRKAFREQ